MADSGWAAAVPGVAGEPEPGPATLVEVDGERFEVRSDGRGGTRYTWLTGPDEGYGYGESPAGGDPRESIRVFLSMIDPATGHIE